MTQEEVRGRLKSLGEGYCWGRGVGIGEIRRWRGRVGLRLRLRLRPAAKAGASFQACMRRGKFHGMI